MNPFLIAGIVVLVIGSLWSALDSYRIPERRDYGIRHQAILQFLCIVVGSLLIILTLTKKI